MADSGFDWGSLIGAIGNYMNQRNQMSHLGDSLPLSDSEQWKLDRAKELYNYSPTRAMMGNGAEQTAGMFNAARNYSPHYQSAYMHGQEGAMPKLPAFDPSFIHAFYQPMGAGSNQGDQGAGGGVSPNRSPQPPGSVVPPRDQQPYMGSNGRNGGDMGGQGLGFDNSPAGHANDIPDWAYDPRTGFNDADRNNLRALMRAVPGIIGALTGQPIGTLVTTVRALYNHYLGNNQQQSQSADNGGIAAPANQADEQARAQQQAQQAQSDRNYLANPTPFETYRRHMGSLMPGQRGDIAQFWGGLTGGSSAGDPAQQPGDEFTNPFLY